MDTKPLCITAWNAILQIQELHVNWVQRHPYPSHYSELFLVSDPEAIDAGQYIAGWEIKAILRFKTIKNGQ